MKDKKHIDHLFQEQLGHFEAAPSPKVWDRIEAELRKEKDDRKVIPLWWKLGGGAALLAFILTIGNGLWTSDPSKKLVVDEDSVETKDVLHNQNKDAVVKEETNAEIPNNNSWKDNQSVEVVASDKSNIGNDTTPQEKEKRFSKDEKTTVIASERTSEKKKATSNQNPKNLIENETAVGKEGIGKEAIANASEISNSSQKNGQLESVDKIPQEKDELGNETVGEAIAKEETNPSKEDEDLPEKNKKSIFEAIEESKKEAVVLEKEKNTKPWEVTPNVGPVYYNSLSGGSSLDPSFTDNAQTGDINFSYGVQVAYQVTDRLSIRTGVQNVNVGYATGGVELATGPSELALKTVAYSNPEKNVLSAFDKGTVPNMPVDPSNPYGQLNLKSTSGNAEIRQSITYYEFPLEAKYALLNTRFGVNMIGGFSTLLLGSNEISVNDGNFRSVLGEANNLNTLSFSTNIGLGFDYKISERFKFNIEPIFKYQLNPYSNSSVDFNPYYFGIYSGLSFKF